MHRDLLNMLISLSNFGADGKQHTRFISQFDAKDILDYVHSQEQKIVELTSNWNELEEWLKEKRDYYDRNDEYSNFRAYADELDDVLGKMEEIKEIK